MNIKLHEIISLGVVSIFLKNASIPHDVFVYDGLNLKSQLILMGIEYAIIGIIMIALTILYVELKECCINKE